LFIWFVKLAGREFVENSEKDGILTVAAVDMKRAEPLLEMLVSQYHDKIDLLLRYPSNPL